MPSTFGRIEKLGEMLVWQPVMVPVSLIKLLTEFAVLHYASRGFRVEPDGMGEACGTLARSWAVENAALLVTFDLNVDAVSAFGARLGKHLGDFFINEGRA